MQDWGNGCDKVAVTAPRLTNDNSNTICYTLELQA